MKFDCPCGFEGKWNEWKDGCCPKCGKHYDDRFMFDEPGDKLKWWHYPQALLLLLAYWVQKKIDKL